MSGKNKAPKKNNAPTQKTTSPKKLSKTGESGKDKLHPKPFPIVGIGASAGGLEAFSKLLEHLSPDLGMAYIFVQHLSPTHESHLPEILRRKTKMNVHEAKNNMPVEKNNVYVIPPNNSLTITDGKLKLIPEPKGKRSFHPIEVLSSNEELQSVNEELETLKEGLQSTTEELMTINEELHNRNVELKEMSEYADAIFESMHESLLILDGDLRVKIANKGFYIMFNVKPEETEGIYIYELGNKQWNLPDLEEQLRTVQRRHIPIVNYEVSHNFPAIGQRTMLLNAQKLPAKEKAESYILLAIQDITDRKQIERTIKESEERFRLLVQNSFDIITVFDESGTIKYISPSVESVLGYTKEEKLGNNILINRDTHPDDFHLKETMFKKSLENPGTNIRAEFRLQHKDGTYRTMDAICMNSLDDSRVQGIIANYRDITERKILEQQKDDFIGIASHELKTPVTSIKAYAQILHEKFLEEGDQTSAEMIYKMHSQIDRLTMLISDLLDFTHIEGDKLKFRSEEYDLNKLILQSVEEMQRLTKKHKLETVLDKTQKMQGDRFRTGEVITNLLSNAIKYSPDANKIIITSKVKDETVTVSIRDFGIGIDEELQKKVFDRFYRISDPSINTFPGLGLGLYIAAGIIKKQGGKIWVKSKKGEGSEFVFSLPVKSKIQ